MLEVYEITRTAVSTTDYILYSYDNKGAQNLETRRIKRKMASASSTALQPWHFTFLSKENRGASPIDKARSSPMCAGSPRLVYNQAVRDASGNNMKHSGQTENCRLSASLPDKPMVAQNEADVWKCFGIVSQNGMLRTFRSVSNSSSKVQLMQGRTSPLRKVSIYLILH